MFEKRNGLIVLRSVNNIKTPALQLRLRLAAWHNQRRRCPVCFELLGANLELHHALISREDVRGLPEDVRILIHHTFNVLLVHRRCHTSLTREESWATLASIYGVANISNWYTNLPARIKRPQLKYYLEGSSVNVY